MTKKDEALCLARAWIEEAVAGGCKLPCASTLAAIREAQQEDLPRVLCNGNGGVTHE